MSDQKGEQKSDLEKTDLERCRAEMAEVPAAMQDSWGLPPNANALHHIAALCEDLGLPDPPASMYDTPEKSWELMLRLTAALEHRHVAAALKGIETSLDGLENAVGDIGGDGMCEAVRQLSDNVYQFLRYYNRLSDDVENIVAVAGEKARAHVI